MALTRRQELTQLRLLLWLKAKLMWRLYHRNTSALVGAIIALVIFLPLSLGMSVGCVIGFRLLAPPMNEHLLRAVLLFVYLFWLASPVMGVALTEEYDIGKVLLYPVSPRLLFASATLASVVDFGVILMAPTLLAVIVGFPHGVTSFCTTVVAVALFLFHTVGLTQAIRLALWGVLRTRRGRDVLMILAGLVMFGFAGAMQIVPRHLASANVNWSRLLNSRFWDILSYLPPGIAARSIAAVERGHYAGGLLLLLALALLSAATVYVAGWLVHLIYTGEVVTGRVGRRLPEKAPAAAPRRTVPARRARLRLPIRLPPVVQAVASKDAKYLLRDPYFKFSLMAVMYMAAIFLAMFLWGPGHGEQRVFRVEQWAVWPLPSFLLMMQAQLAFNLFGIEGPAVSLLFTFPSDRKQMLMGKNLPVFVALLCITSPFALLFCLLAKSLPVFPVVVLWTALAAIMLISAGNLTSMWAPVRIVMRGWRPQPQSSGRSLYRGLVSMGMIAVAGLLSVPVLGGLMIPVQWLGSWWLALTIPLAVAYTAVCYMVSLHLAEREFARRDIEIIEKLSEAD